MPVANPALGNGGVTSESQEWGQEWKLNGTTSKNSLAAQDFNRKEDFQEIAGRAGTSASWDAMIPKSALAAPDLNRKSIFWGIREDDTGRGPWEQGEGAVNDTIFKE